MKHISTIRVVVQLVCAFVCVLTLVVGCQNKVPDYGIDQEWERKRQRKLLARKQLGGRGVEITLENYQKAIEEDRTNDVVLFQHAGFSMGMPTHTNGFGSHLSWFAMVGDIDAVRDQLAKGTDINTTTDDPDGRTPLMRACEGWQNEPEKMVEFLIDKGANVNYEINCDGKVGGTPLQVACEYGRVNIVKLLLDAGARIDGERGEIAMSGVLTTSIEGLSEKERIAILELLKAKGLRLGEFKTLKGVSTVRYAARSEALLKWSIVHGVELQGRPGAETIGQTILNNRTKEGLRILKLLLNQGADPNCQCTEGVQEALNSVSKDLQWKREVLTVLKQYGWKDTTVSIQQLSPTNSP